MKPSSLRHSSIASTNFIRATIALIVIAVAAWAQYGSTLNDAGLANEWLRDQFIRSHASDQAETRIVIVDIDESSLARIGRWPWPRARIADLVDALLHDYGAKGVALDMVLPEPADDAGDTRLAQLARTEPVALAQALDYANRPTDLRIGTVSGAVTFPDVSKLPAAYGYIANHAKFGALPFTGNIGFIPDSDGAIRRLPLLTNLDGKAYPTLTLALLKCSASLPTHELPPAYQLRRVPFERNLSAYAVVAAGDVLDLLLPASLIANKLVLIGSSSLGLADSIATPLSPNTSGVFVHAAMLTSLLDQAAGVAPAPWPGKLIAFIFSVAIVLVSGFTLSKLSAFFNATLLLFFSSAWILLAYWIAPHDGDFSVTGPLFSAVLLLTVAVPFHWQISQRKSRELIDTLNHYVDPAVVNELLSSKVADPLALRQHNITTLVADMEGYTKHIEGLPLEEAAILTREFLDCLTQPVLSCRGTLDKYTGDGLVAFWGAPIRDDHHADLALDAAKQILQSVRRLNQTRTLNGKPPLRVRIGIESGVAMSGDFGSSSRSIFTAVGDSVNTASRLQEVARDLPHNVIVGPGTALEITRHQLVPLGSLQLRGKQNPTQLFTLAAPGSACDAP